MRKVPAGIRSSWSSSFSASWTATDLGAAASEGGRSSIFRTGGGVAPSALASADRHRREYTWPIYLSGGQLEYILADLIKTDDFRKYEPVWKYTWYARKFLEENLPFWEMEPMDQLLTGAATYQGKNNLVTGQVFAQPGEVYAIYAPVGDQTGTLDLTGARGTFLQRWYNPRTGEFASTSRIIEGGRSVVLGLSPTETAEDWAILIRRTKEN